jgi:hypothetical protein
VSPLILNGQGNEKEYKKGKELRGVQWGKEPIDVKKAES